MKIILKALHWIRDFFNSPRVVILVTGDCIYSVRDSNTLAAGVGRKEIK